MPVFLFSVNSTLVENSAVSRATLLMIAVAGLLVWSLRVVVPDLALRSVLVSFLFLSLPVKNLTGLLLHVPVLNAVVCSQLHLIVNVGTLGAIVWAATRLRGKALLETRAILNTIAVATLGITVGHLAASEWSREDAGWQQSVSAFLGDMTNVKPSTRPNRDIYYIVVDSYPRADTLAQLYDVERDPLVEFLAESGFHVARDARTNYPWTLLSVASSLNMDYLNEFEPETLKQGGARPLRFLIQNSAVMEIVKQQGYEVVLLSSGLAATSSSAVADRVVCGDHGVTEYETHLIGLTPLNPVAYELHRRNVRCQLDALQDVEDSHQPKFVFAHVMAPHPPFVFDEHGCAVRPAAPFRFADGVCSAANYVPDFKRQAQFLATELREAIRLILDRPGETPIIIVQSDHGPGSQLNSVDAHATNVDERFGILSAYLLPGRDDDWMRDRMTPVNTFRIVFNEYFGTDFPLLADRSYYAAMSNFYEFTDVTDRIRDRDATRAAAGETAGLPQPAFD